MKSAFTILVLSIQDLGKKYVVAAKTPVLETVGSSPSYLDELIPLEA